MEEAQLKFETQSAKLRKDSEKLSDTQFLRSELITLAEKGEIKRSVAYIKKANPSSHRIRKYSLFHTLFYYSTSPI